MRKTIRFLTLLALLIAAATGARAQNATASHIIKAYTTNKTATMNEVLPYKASIIEVVSAVTGISGNVLTISGTVTNVNSSNTDVVTFGALEGWNTKFKVIAAGEAKISVTISNNANPLEFFISVIPPFNISLTSGTEDADKWKVKVGTANATGDKREGWWCATSFLLKYHAIDDLSGITNVGADKLVSDGIYTIDGLRVESGAPLRQGIYVVVKNGRARLKIEN